MTIYDPYVTPYHYVFKTGISVNAFKIILLISNFTQLMNRRRMHGGALVGALMGCDPSRIHHCVIYPHDGYIGLALKGQFWLKKQNLFTETVDQDRKM